METHHNTKENDALMAVLAYVGPLVIISYLVAKNNAFVKFHIKQGLVLFGIEIVLWIVLQIFWPLWFLINIVNLGLFILSVIGIINAIQNKEKELPIVGHLAKNISI